MVHSGLSGMIDGLDLITIKRRESDPSLVPRTRVLSLDVCGLGSILSVSASRKPRRQYRHHQKRISDVGHGGSGRQLGVQTTAIGNTCIRLDNDANALLPSLVVHHPIVRRPPYPTAPVSTLASASPILSPLSIEYTEARTTTHGGRRKG